MRCDELRGALRRHLEAVSRELQSELAGGVEVPFELERHGGRRGRGASLYCYRPLTREFIAEREAVLRALASHREALLALEQLPGLERYLLAMGLEVPPAREAARAALNALTEDAFGEQSDFELREERLRAALGRLEGSLEAAPSEVTLIGSLHGMTISASELAIASGLRILRGSAPSGLPPSLLAGEESDRELEGFEDERLLVVLEREHGEPASAIEEGRCALAELLRALRLFGDGRIALGRLGACRVGKGGWHPIALGEGGRPRGMLLVAAEQEDELRAFCNLVCRRTPRGGPVAWALRRFEFGCERANPVDGLSDHLQALSVLLEADGELLAARLGVLCAKPDEREQLTGRLHDALELERECRAAEVPIAGAAAEELAREVADHLRALLRDVICGHLPADLPGLADQLAAQEDPAPAEPATAEAAVAHTADPLSSLEEILGDPRQAEEILDVLI